MKSVFNIARAELQTLFYSPVAWLIIIIFTFQVSMGFSTTLEGWQQYFAQGYKSPGISMDLFANQLSGLFTQVLSYLYLYIPLLTMGLMSREFASGSIKLLYSSPVTDAQIILGKYLSMMLYALILIAILLVYVVAGWIFIPDFELPAILMGVLGVYLLICAYSAIGLFMSSLTSYQVVAAMGTLAVLAVLNYVGGLWQDIEFVRDITYWLSISGRANNFLLGLFCTEDFLYFIIVVTLFLMLTIIRLTSVRQKNRASASLWKYASAIAMTILLGYATSRPTLMKYYDATSTKFNTLTPNSQKVIEKLRGDLTITTYTNILDDSHLWLAQPVAVNIDLARFKQYTRFKPEIKTKYVYYYDTLNNPGLDRRYPGLTDKQRMQKITDIYKINEKLIRSPEEIRKEIDLSGEGNLFVRSIRRGSGEQTFLRVFDDQAVLPTETEITAALKRLTMDIPKIGFLHGQGERDNHKLGDRNYNRFAQDKPFRYSLVNQGFDATDVTLDSEIPKDVNIIVIADMRSELTVHQKENLDKYIARGGNLLIAGDAGRQRVMDELVQPFGVRFVPGILVNPNENFQADFIISKPTREADTLSYIYGQMDKRKVVVTMPGAVGLDYSTDKGFDVTPLFVSDSSSWNEVETTNFIDDTARLNPAAGEVQKSYATGLALSRKIAGKTQKIIVLGDADCIGNGEISIGRNGVRAANYSVITGAFYWMSDNELPIDVRRPSPTDDKLSLDKKSLFNLKIVLMWVWPGLLALCAILIWVRRRGR